MTTPHKPITAPKMAIRTAVILLVFVTLFTGLLSAAYLWTRPALAAAAREEQMRLIDEVLPRSRYDNALLEDSIVLDNGLTAYRARKDGKAVALVVEAVAPDGYAGKIRLLLAVAPGGTLFGVRVTEHKETPGLGDYIEPKKDKNKTHPWITQFDGTNPAEIDAQEWRVKKDGGRFDSMAGATVTPRAVIKAVRKAVLEVVAHRDDLFAAARKEGQP
ncbi:electron transport complex subunit RsxG [Propionivibrio dicarboxylicus]|uniref:Ion-translocating oxidoreductase complex subunit G n=1 Tax=Propionivibrio dicarboxylicus TaxID=83767 RepID=A0A1G8BZB2_9RHOO|nr:electron transport complex subunit RsxG [Propionivibrio dicarboxylicus]SDH38464.1 electron transport complex protein RnfG [Propionivibrio dicarboxylicus]